MNGGRPRAPSGAGIRGSGEPVEAFLVPPTGAPFPTRTGGFEYLRHGFVAGPLEGELLRSWGDPDAPHVLGISPAGGRWRVRAWGVDAATARREVRTLLSLDDPIAEFYAAVRRDPVLRGSERRFRGLRIPRDGSLVQALVHAVIGQQLSVAVATTFERRLVALAGSHRTVEGIDVPYLPGPRTILALDPGALAGIGLSRAKQAAIRGIAEEAVGGAFDDVAGFAAAPREEAIDRLDALPGVGRWTAENALLRGAGRRDVFLAGDLGLRGALAAYGAVPAHARESDARDWGERWYPGWGSYATLYLWRKWVADGCPRPVATPARGPRIRGAGAPRRPLPVGSRTASTPRRPGSRS